MALLPSPSALLSPSAVIELTRSAVGQVIETAAAVATIPVRAMSLLGQAELLVTRITVLADSAETLIDRVSAIVAEAQETVSTARTIAAAAALTVDEAATLTTAAAVIVGEAGTITAAAAGIVGEAGTITGGAAQLVGEAGTVTTEAARVVARAEAATTEVVDLLDGYTGTLRKAAPLAAKFVEELTPEEVSAAIKMVDELPQLREHLVSDVMPLLGKLDQVGPDLHNLLEVTKDLHLAIAGLPGLKMLRRRGEERVAEDGEAAAADRR